MKRLINKSKLILLKGDITEQTTTAIVNAANSSLLGGGGVDGAIHKAGGSAILEECKKIRRRQGKLPAGEAVITTAGEMKADFVIHTVGPVWQGGSKNEKQLLKNCYQNSLKLALENDIHSISFPSISTGAYRFPVKKASEIALTTMVKFLEKTEKQLNAHFVLFSDDDYQIYKKTLKEILD